MIISILLLVGLAGLCVVVGRMLRGAAWAFRWALYGIAVEAVCAAFMVPVLTAVDALRLIV